MTPLALTHCDHVAMGVEAKKFQKLSLKRCKRWQDERILIEIESLVDHIEESRNSLQQPMVIPAGVGQQADAPLD
jgi:hypothetical protein